MNELPKKLFESLEPPRGGRAQLRARIERDARRNAALRRARFALGGVAVIVIAALFAMNADRRGNARLPEFERARVSLGLAEPPTEPFTIAAGQGDRVAARRVELNSDRVIFYLVASVTSEPVTEPFVE